MNIFYLDDDPVKAAKYLHDTHVRKMIIESCQMLANAYTLERLAEKDCPKTQAGKPRKHSYLHHRCSKWVLESESNFRWLIYHATQLIQEYKNRFGKTHFCETFILWATSNWPNLPKKQGTLPLYAFGDHFDECNDPDPVVAYRKYYNLCKLTDKNGKSLAVWTNAIKPSWIKDN